MVSPATRAWLRVLAIGSICQSPVAELSVRARARRRCRARIRRMNCGSVRVSETEAAWPKIPSSARPTIARAPAHADRGSKRAAPGDRDRPRRAAGIGSVNERCSGTAKPGTSCGPGRKRQSLCDQRLPAEIEENKYNRERDREPEMDLRKMIARPARDSLAKSKRDQEPIMMISCDDLLGHRTWMLSRIWVSGCSQGMFESRPRGRAPGHNRSTKIANAERLAQMRARGAIVEARSITSCLLEHSRVSKEYEPEGGSTTLSHRSRPSSATSREDASKPALSAAPARRGMRIDGLRDSGRETVSNRLLLRQLFRDGGAADRGQRSRMVADSRRVSRSPPSSRASRPRTSALGMRWGRNRSNERTEESCARGDTILGAHRKQVRRRASADCARVLDLRWSRFLVVTTFVQ